MQYDVIMMSYLRYRGRGVGKEYGSEADEDYPR